MTLNIKALANRFYMKYYPEILSSNEADLDKHHGCMQEKFGADCKHIDFFDNFVSKDFEDTGEYSRFKAEIFGIGKSKFFYNEHNLLDFNHSECKTLTDAIFNHKKISHSINAESELAEHDEIYSKPFDEKTFLNHTCTWVCIVDKNDEVAYYVISDVMSHAGWIFQEKSNDKIDELTNPIQIVGDNHGLVEETTGEVYYDIKDQYPTKTIEALADDLIEYAYEMSNKYTNIVKEHFSNHPVIFYKENDDDHNANLIIVPSLAVGSNFNILDFETSLQNSDFDSVSVIDEYANSLIDDMNKEIDDKFKELHHKYENSTDIFSKSDKNRTPILLPREVFVMMTAVEDDDDED